MLLPRRRSLPVVQPMGGIVLGGGGLWFAVAVAGVRSSPDRAPPTGNRTDAPYQLLDTVDLAIQRTVIG